MATCLNSSLYLSIFFLFSYKREQLSGLPVCLLDYKVLLKRGLLLQEKTIPKS